jgi:Na+-driven multidrug efflux pump
MIMVTLTSIALGALGYVLSPQLLALLGVAPDVYEQALGFMRVAHQLARDAAKGR